MPNLEHFPTSKAARRMIESVSPVYEKSYVAKWLYQVMGIEFDEAWRVFDELRLQAFLESATWGIDYWEERYGIAPDHAWSIIERRHRAMGRRGIRAPMSPARLEQIAADITGRSAAITEQGHMYTFTLAIAPGDSLVNYDELSSVVRNVKPSHIAAIVLIQTDVGVVVRIHDQETYAFPYTLTGTVPDTNIVGSLANETFVLDTDISSHLFGYIFPGAKNTGEFPETNIAGGLEQRTVSTDVDLTGTLFGYQLCGEAERDN